MTDIRLRCMGFRGNRLHRRKTRPQACVRLIKIMQNWEQHQEMCRVLSCARLHSTFVCICSGQRQMLYWVMVSNNKKMLIVASKTSRHCATRYEFAELSCKWTERIRPGSISRKRTNWSFALLDNLKLTRQIMQFLPCQEIPTSAFSFNCTSLWLSLTLCLSVSLSRSPSSHSPFLSVCAPLSLLPVSLIRNPVKIAQAKQGGFDQALISTVDSVSAHPDSTEPRQRSSWRPGIMNSGARNAIGWCETMNEFVEFTVGFLRIMQHKRSVTQKPSWVISIPQGL